MIIVVTGSRHWRNFSQLENVLAEYRDTGATLINGGARGVDTMCATVWRAFGLPLRTINADWSKGRGAGFARNIEMLDLLEDGDLVLAFRAAGKSNGTDHTIRVARERGLKVRVTNEAPAKHVLTPDTTPGPTGLTESGFCACGMEDRECEGDRWECP